MRFVDSYDQCSTHFLLYNNSKIAIKLLNSFPNWKIVVGSLVARTRILDYLNRRIEYWSYFMGANLGVKIRVIQPKRPQHAQELQEKYAAIADIKEGAFTILVDLGMVDVTN